MLTFERECPNCGKQSDFPIAHIHSFEPRNLGAHRMRAPLEFPPPDHFAAIGHCPKCDCPSFVTFAAKETLIESIKNLRGDLGDIAFKGSIKIFPPEGESAFNTYPGEEMLFYQDSDEPVPEGSWLHPTRIFL